MRIRGRRLAAAPIAAGLLLFWLHAEAAQTPAPGDKAVRHVDRAQLMRDVTTLSGREFEGRATGSPGGQRARDWIAAQFRAIGLAPAAAGGFVQPFAAASGHGANVVGRVAGRDVRARPIVVTAHYDHFGVRGGVTYPGADDNASGVAALLAAARHFRMNPPRRALIVAALDAEEIGLEGARALLASGLLPRGQVALNVNLDMVSRSATNEIYAAGTYQSPWLRAMLLDVQTRAAVRIRFGHDRPASAGDGLKDWTRSSDHAVFHDAGIPFVYFGVEDHPDYHAPTDTADRIDPRFFGDAADMIVEAIRTFDAAIDAARP